MKIATIDEIIIAYAYRCKLNNNSFHKNIYINLVQFAVQNAKKS